MARLNYNAKIVEERTNNHGYVQVRARFNGSSYSWEFLHRIEVMKVLDRALTTKEVVHHRDLNRSNNAIENLILMPDEGDHRALHRLLKSKKTEEWKATEILYLEKMYV